MPTDPDPSENKIASFAAKHLVDIAKAVIAIFVAGWLCFQWVNERYATTSDVQALQKKVENAQTDITTIKTDVSYIRGELSARREYSKSEPVENRSAFKR